MALRISPDMMEMACAEMGRDFSRSDRLTPYPRYVLNSDSLLLASTNSDDPRPAGEQNAIIHYHTVVLFYALEKSLSIEE